MRKMEINQKSYDIEDPSQFFKDLFTFRKENKSYFPFKHWELVLGSLIGGMGSGKSTLIEFIAQMGATIFENKFSCYQTDNVVSALETLNKTPEKRTDVIFFFLDDALTKPGSDSRRAMSAANVEASQDLSVIRHLLANEDEYGVPDPRFKKGFCAIFYAIQDPARLDPFIRRNLHISLYKTHYDVLNKIVNKNSLEFIRGVTEDSMYRHNYEARGFALGLTKTGGTLQLYFPKTDYKIPIIYDDGPKYEQIIDALLKLPLDEIKDGILKGFIYEFCQKHKIKLDNRDISKIIDTSRYLAWKSQEDLPDLPSKKISKQQQQAELIEQIEDLLRQGIGWRDIGLELGKDFNTLFNLYKKYCAKHKRPVIQSVKGKIKNNETKVLRKNPKNGHQKPRSN